MRIKFFACTAVILLAGTRADAFEVSECMGEPLRWRTPSTTMFHHQGTMPVGGQWSNSFSVAISRVNENPSHFRFAEGRGWPFAEVNNGFNEAWRTIDQLVLEGAPARVIRQFDCVEYWIFGRDIELTEMDVVFDADWGWTTSMRARNLYIYDNDRDGTAFEIPDDGLSPFENTAIHELGHALGLMHESDTYNVMGADMTHIHANGAMARSYFGEDAGNGAVFLYGLRPDIQDLSVTHWKRTDQSGGYSWHGLTGLMSSCTNGRTPLPTTVDPVSSERYHAVNPRQSVWLELTYENNGATTQSTRTGYYVSTNNFISGGDRRINTWSMTVGRNVVWTPCRRLTIPNDLTPGRNYWLGARIDDDTTLTEVTDINNATYSPIPIRVN